MELKNTPVPFAAYLRSIEPDPVKRAAMLSVLTYITDESADVRSVDDLSKRGSDYRVDLERRHQQGRKDRDFDATIRDLTHLAGAMGAALGDKKGGAALSSAADIAGHIMDLTAVQDWVQKDRALYSGVVSAELVSQLAAGEDVAIERFHDVCLADDVCSKAAKIVYPNLGAPADDKVEVQAAAVIRSNPDVFSVVLRDSVQADSSLQLDLDALRASVAEGFTETMGSLHVGLNDVHVTLKEIADQNVRTYKLLTDAAEQERARIRDAELRARNAQTWQNLESAIGVTATIAGLFDKKLGADIRRVGGAGLQVAKAGAALVSSVATIASKGLSLATAIGSAAATGNFIGAAMSLVGCFLGGPAGPPPEQIILDEVKALREDIREFARQNEARFDSIDRQLRNIYVDVLSELDRIRLDLAQIEGKVDDVLDRLAAQELQIARLQRSLIRFLQSQQRLELQVGIATALGRPSRSAEPVMAPDEFLRFEGLFYSWAHHSADPEETLTTDRATDDDSLYAELQGSLGDNITYINHVLFSKQATNDTWPTLTDSVDDRVPNFDTWAVAASAYAQLEREWPALAKAASDLAPGERRTAVAAVGDEILTAMRRAALGVGDGRDLYGVLVANVSEKGDAYGTALQRVADSWLNTKARAQAGVPNDQPLLKLYTDRPWEEVGFKPSYAFPDKVPPEVIMRVPPEYRNVAWLRSDVLKISVWDQIEQTGTKEVLVRPKVKRPVGRILSIEELRAGAEQEYEEEPAEFREVPVYSATCSVQVLYEGRELHSYFYREAEATHGLAWYWREVWTPKLVAGEHLRVSQLFQDYEEEERLDSFLGEVRSFVRTHLFDDLTAAQRTLGDEVYVTANRLDGAVRLLELLLEFGLPTIRTHDEVGRAIFDSEPGWMVLGAWPPRPGGLKLPTATDYLGLFDWHHSNGGSPWPNAPYIYPFDDFIRQELETGGSLLLARIRDFQQSLRDSVADEFYMQVELTLERLVAAGGLVTIA